MNMWRTMVIGLAGGCLLAAGIARAGIETFDGTGLGSGWVAAGSFTGQQGVVWTYANARGAPTVYTSNPSITLRVLTAADNGWLRSQTLTGGVGRVSAIFKQDLTKPVDCNVCINGTVIGTYKSAGVMGAIETVSFEAFMPSNRMPFANDFTLVVSNRVTTGGAVALDDLTWEPFRLFVRLDRTGTNTTYADKEFDVIAEVFDIGQAVGGGWSIQPAFAGTLSDTNSTHWTLTPADADAGQIFTLTYAATDSEGDGYTNQASCQIKVLEALNPRFVNFEGASFGYDTNGGVTTNLNGMPWFFFNVMTSDVTDTRIGTTSARFRHSSLALPASMESLETFDTVGEISLHGAYYESNSVVKFEVQTKGDSEDATWTTNGVFNVENHGDITNSVFSFEVQRSEPVFVKLITTGNFNQKANIDNVHISAFGEVPPRLVWNGGTNAPVGRETVLDFTLLNAEEIVLRDWEFSIAPENTNAVFEVMPDKNLQLRFSPVDTNEWGDYQVAVTARLDSVVAAVTSVTLRVVSAPTFTLAPIATNVVVTNRLDVWVTNVVLHGTNLTGWSTEWSAAPAFAQPATTTNKSRYLLNNGTTEADVGLHTLTAVLTDSGTGVKTTNAVDLTVTSSGGGDITTEVYPILTFGLTNVVVSGRTARVFVAFGVTNMTCGAEETNWVWQGLPITNTDGADVLLELPETPDPRLFFYGVKVRAAP